MTDDVKAAAKTAVSKPELAKPAIAKALLTPFNAFAAVVVTAGLIVIAIRFVLGLGATTNLSDAYGWGFWIGFGQQLT